MCRGTTRTAFLVSHGTQAAHAAFAARPLPQAPRAPAQADDPLLVLAEAAAIVYEATSKRFRSKAHPLETGPLLLIAQPLPADGRRNRLTGREFLLAHTHVILARVRANVDSEPTSLTSSAGDRGRFTSGVHRVCVGLRARIVRIYLRFSYPTCTPFGSLLVP